VTAERFFAGGILAVVFAVVVVTSMASEEEVRKVDAAPSEGSAEEYEPWELPDHLPAIAIEPFDRLPQEPAGDIEAVSTRLDGGELRSVAETIRRELDRYPPAFLARIRLFRVALCESLVVDSDPAGGVALAGPGLICLAVHADSPGASSFLRAIHHEVFHLADAADERRNHDPALLGEFHVDYERDPLRKRELRRATGSLQATLRYPGFLTGYSRHDPGEDFAELFSFLMVDPRLVQRRADHDAVIAAKLALAQETLKRLAPEDPEFWRR